MDIGDTQKSVRHIKEICPICGYSFIREEGEGITRILSMNGDEIYKNFSYSYPQPCCCKNKCYFMQVCKNDDEYNFIRTMTNAGIQVHRFNPTNTFDFAYSLLECGFDPEDAYIELIPMQWNVRILLNRIIDDILSNIKYKTLAKLVNINSIYVFPNFNYYLALYKNSYSSDLPEFSVNNISVFHEFYKELTIRFRDILGLY